MTKKSPWFVLGDRHPRPAGVRGRPKRQARPDGRGPVGPQVGERAEDLARRDADRLYRQRDRPQAGRLRQPDLAGRGRNRADVSADPGRQIQWRAGLVPRRQMARLHQQPGRGQEPDFRHQSRRWRSRPADERRERRRRIQVVARREDHRLCRLRAGAEGRSRTAKRRTATTKSSARNTRSATSGRSTSPRPSRRPRRGSSGRKAAISRSEEARPGPPTAGRSPSARPSTPT